MPLKWFFFQQRQFLGNIMNRLCLSSEKREASDGKTLLRPGLTFYVTINRYDSDRSCSLINDYIWSGNSNYAVTPPHCGLHSYNSMPRSDFIPCLAHCKTVEQRHTWNHHVHGVRTCARLPNDFEAHDLITLLKGSQWIKRKVKPRLLIRSGTNFIT